MFFKGHGLGNDYLVFEAGDDWVATEANVRLVCERHTGVGADGIVVLVDLMDHPSDASRVIAHLRMFNPDGGEFERSGNGLRIFGSSVAGNRPHTHRIDATVGGEEVVILVHGRDGSHFDVSVQMGQGRVGREAVSLAGGTELTDPDGGPLTVVPVSIGNPHLVVVVDDASESSFTENRLAAIGPFLSAHPALAHGANVQLARVDGPASCRGFIWERGVGRTSASGTSACAIAVAMVSTGRVAPGLIAVHMPGGSLEVDVTSDLQVVLRGPVQEILNGQLRPEFVATFEPGS
jgi:diaminopimelate epimerase